LSALGRTTVPSWRKGALILACLVLLGAGLVPRSAAAAEFDEGGAPEAVEVHGFVSQGFILTVGNEFISERSTDGSFEFTEVGVNFTKNLGERLRLGIQLFAQDLGPIGDYRPRVDWFYLDYAWRDWLGLRVGRLKIPYGLYNEIQDVDAARVPVLLPGSVYPLQSREILFAHSGGELYGFKRSRALGALDYRVFGGTIFLDSDALTPRDAAFELEFYVPYVVGGRLLWETPLEGFRFGGSLEFVRLETAVIVPDFGTIDIVSESLLWVASAEYTAADLVLTAEYSRWHNNQSSDNDTISPPIEVTNERAYAMATYRVAPWFQPGAYYALLFPDTQMREGRENVQHDLALTLRFDVSSHWLVKLEGHYMNGTAGLNNPLSINPPDISSADRSWAAFFLKTTAHF
jgi:hypothetical protein